MIIEFLSMVSVPRPQQDVPPDPNAPSTPNPSQPEEPLFPSIPDSPELPGTDPERNPYPKYEDAPPVRPVDSRPATGRVGLRS